MRRFWLVGILLWVMVLGGLPSQARSIVAPWDPASQSEFRSLVYASSTIPDVQRVCGPPSEIVRSEQMYPVIENHYYYDENGSGAASVFVFENGVLMGFHYKSPDNQLVDLTFCLANNGDIRLAWPYRAGYYGYSPNFPMVGW